jgi:hypothetical protein
MSEHTLGTSMGQREAWTIIRDLIGEQQRFRPRQPFTSQRSGQRFNSLRLFTAAANLASGGDIVALLIKFLDAQPAVAQKLTGMRTDKSPNSANFVTTLP